MKKTDHVFRRKTHGFAVEINGLCAVIVIQCNGSTQTPVLRVISTRKNCPQFKPSVPKHNSVSPAQTCRRRGCANRDRRTTSARHVSTACAATRVLRRGSGSEDSHIHTKLFTSRREVSLWQVTRTMMGGWRTTHQGCYVAGQLPRCASSTRHYFLVTRCTCSGPGGLLKGRRVPGLPHQHMRPSVCARCAPSQPSGKGCRQARAALADLSLVMGHWLASLLLDTQVWKI